MIKLLRDNILVKEVVKDSKVGVLTISQDEDSDYMVCRILSISDDAKKEFNIDNIDNIYLVISRIAKIPFIKDQFFISCKDVRAIIDDDYFNSI